MGQPIQLKALLLGELSFRQGKWHGEIDAVFTYGNRQLTVSVPYIYDRFWRLQAFKYPIVPTDAERLQFRSLFNEEFAKVSHRLVRDVFQPREMFAEQPTLSAFSITNNESLPNRLAVSFRLLGVHEQFQMTIELIEEHWHYHLSARTLSIDTYKTFHGWEDAVFDVICARIEQEPNYRLKFALYKRKWKYKEDA